MKYKLNGLFDETTLNSIKELVGEDAYSKLSDFEVDSSVAKFVPHDKFNEQLESNKSLSAQIKERDTQIGELSKFKGSSEDLNAKIAELTAANQKASQEYESKLLQTKTSYAWDKALSKTKAKNSNALKGMLDSSKITYDAEKDTLIGFDEQVAAIQKDNAWLFTETQPPQGGYKPQENAGGVPSSVSKEEMELRQAMGLPIENKK